MVAKEGPPGGSCGPVENATLARATACREGAGGWQESIPSLCPPSDLLLEPPWGEPSWEAAAWDPRGYSLLRSASRPRAGQRKAKEGWTGATETSQAHHLQMMLQKASPASPPSQHCALNQAEVLGVVSPRHEFGCSLA